MTTGAPWARPEAPPAHDDATAARPVAAPALGRQIARRGVGLRARRDADVPGLTVFSRPLTMADTLDDAFAVLRARPQTLLFLTMVIVLPVRLFGAWLTRAGLGGPSIPAALADPENYQDGTATTSYLLVWLLDTTALVVLTAVLSRLVEGWWGGRDMSPTEALRAVPARAIAALPLGVVAFAPLTAASVVTGAPALVAVIVLGMPLVGWLLILVPAAAIEGAGAVGTFRRAWRLSTTRRWAGLVTVGVAGAVGVVLAQTLPLLFSGVKYLIGTEPLWELVAVGIVATSMLTSAFLAAVVVLQYLDLRVRREGADIAMALAERRPSGDTGAAAAR